MTLIRHPGSDHQAAEITIDAGTARQQSAPRQKQAGSATTLTASEPPSPATTKPS